MVRAVVFIVSDPVRDRGPKAIACGKSLRALVREKADAQIASKIQGWAMEIFAICCGLIVVAIILPPLIRFSKG